MMATVTHLFVKRKKYAIPVSVPAVSAQKGYGLEDDVHADSISPRQILITRREDLDELHIPYGGLLENMIVAGLDVHDFQPGALLIVGENAKIRLTFHCEPCKRIADVVPSLAAMVKKRGILGVITESGTMQVGDEVTSHPGRFDPLPERAYERFLDFMKCVPAGKVVTYPMILRGMGVASGYFRAIPGYIKKAQAAGIDVPLHRMVETDGSAIPLLLLDQLERLGRENVVVRQSSLVTPATFVVPLDEYLWGGKSLYQE